MGGGDVERLTRDGGILEEAVGTGEREVERDSTEERESIGVWGFGGGGGGGMGVWATGRQRLAMPGHQV
jgi:hypothetical protein